MLPIATALNRSVIQSTVYSKSVLRVAAEEIVRAFAGVAYFPSYEIITGPGARGRYFGPDCREVLPAGVDHVMRLFLEHYGEETPMQSASVIAPDTAMAEIGAVERSFAVACDEEILAHQANGK